MAEPEPRSPNASNRASVSWPVAAVLGTGVIALGGVTVSTSLVIAVVVVAGAAWATRSREFAMSRLSWLLLLLGGFTLLGAVPLPIEPVAWVSPEVAALFRETSALLGDASRFATLSLEPQGSRLEALRLFTYAVFAGLCQRTVRQSGSSGLCLLVALAATAVALSTIAHQLVDAQTVFGWYRPAYSSFVAPLMNPNTLSGFLELGLFCAAGLLVDGRSSQGSRFAALSACLVCSATILWLGSRAGVALLLLGLPAFACWVFWWSRDAEHDAARRQLVWLGAAALLGFVFAAFSSVRLHRELLDESLDKLSVISPALAAIERHWLLGAGRGAFSVAVSPFMGGDARFENAEIFPLWFAVEWGLPVALVLLIALGRWFFRPLARLSPPRFGAYLGLCLLWVHNLADFSLEVPLVALGAIAAFEATGTRAVRHRANAGWATSLALLVTLAASLVFAPVELGRLARARLAAALTRGPITQRALDDVVRAHPADAFFLRLEGAAALARQAPETLRWIGLALERAPGSGPTLLLLGDALVARGRPGQALGAYRRAAAAEPRLSEEVARRALLVAAEPSEVIPQGPAGVEVARALVRLATDPAVRLRLAREAAERAPNSREAALDLTNLLLRSPEEACLREFSKSCREAFAERRRQLADEGARLLELDAEFLAKGGRREEAFRLLADRCPRGPEGLGCLAAWVHHGRERPLADQLEAIDAYLAVACASATGCAAAEERVGGELVARGELRLGAAHFVSAARREPSLERWVRVARLGRDTGNLAMLEGALGEVARLGATPPGDLAAAAEELRRSKLVPDD